MNGQDAYDASLLALCVWREASNQPVAAKLAVAWSIRNRVQHPSWYGGTWSEVICKKFQYSSMTNPGDPNLVRWPLETDTSWQAALEVAQAAISGSGSDPTGGAVNYYSLDIPEPPWAAQMTFTVAIGSFRFYRK